eukprot:3837124-Rhodomonas_salina.1
MHTDLKLLCFIRRHSRRRPAVRQVAIHCAHSCQQDRSAQQQQNQADSSSREEIRAGGEHGVTKSAELGVASEDLKAAAGEEGGGALRLLQRRLHCLREACGERR